MCVFSMILFYFLKIGKKWKFNVEKIPCVCWARSVCRLKNGWYHFCFDKLHLYQKAIILVKIWYHFYRNIVSFFKNTCKMPHSPNPRHTALSEVCVMYSSFCSATLAFVKIEIPTTTKKHCNQELGQKNMIICRNQTVVKN